MPTEMETLAEVLAAANDWKAQADALLADRVAHQQAYEALATNLIGVVKDQMGFTATIDPDEANPTNVTGGTFTTIKAAIDAAPGGADIKLTLLADKTYDFTATNVDGQSVEFLKSGAGANPVLRPLSQTYFGTHNILGGFVVKRSGGVFFTDIDFDFTADKVDPALPWSNSFRHLVRWERGNRVDVKMHGCTATAGADATWITDCRQTSIVNASLFNCTFDGSITVVGGVGLTGGIALVANSGVTLLNGAALVNDATGLGTDLLETAVQN